MTAFASYAWMDASHRTRGSQESEGDDEERGNDVSDRREADVVAGGGHLRDHGAADAADETALRGARVRWVGGWPRGKPRRKRIAVQTLEQLCRLKRERYADFSVQHFWEQATEKHKIAISYTWTKLVLQAAGLAQKTAGRGCYRRRRERRALRGMMLHMDASTHEWIAGLPMQDLVVVQDDADSRILYARFVPQEGAHSTFAALHAVLRQHGRFCELYTDRGSHFCHTPVGKRRNEWEGSYVHPRSSTPPRW
jgi:hypothetical protein